MESWLLWIKNVFFGVFYQNFGPQKYHFCLGNRAQNVQTTDAQEKVKKINIAWDIANNGYVNSFFQIKLNKSKQSKNRKKPKLIGAKCVLGCLQSTLYQ